MPQTYLYPVVSRSTLDFLAALAAAAASLTPPYAGSVMANIPGVPPIGSRRFLIRAISMKAVQNLGLEFDFFSTAAGIDATVAGSTFISRYQMASSNGAQFNAAGPYEYYVDGLAVPYYDADAANSQTPPSLHVAIQNVDTVAKLGDAAGALEATFWLEPMQAW